MQFLLNIEDRLLDELKEISNGEQKPMTAQDLDNLKDMSEALVNITTYCAMKNSKYDQDGFSSNSGNGYSNAMRGQSVYNRMGGMSNAMSNNMGYSRMRDGGRSYHNDWDRDERMMYQMRPDMY